MRKAVKIPGFAPECCMQCNMSMFTRDRDFFTFFTPRFSCIVGVGVVGGIHGVGGITVYVCVRT